VRAKPKGVKFRNLVARSGVIGAVGEKAEL